MIEPLVTIITVTYNAKSVLEDTIFSVLNQTYSNIEYIIIDGGSTDGTVDLIRKFSDKVSFWISEPDNGIYDAMNKGIAASKGEWINFMNAGDVFFNENVIKGIFSEPLKERYSIIYGKTLVIYPHGKYIVTPSRLSKISEYMPFCHQSTFVKSSLLKENKFDIRCKIAADYNFFYKAYQKNPSIFYYYSEVIAVYDAIAGISSINVSKLCEEVKNISGKEDKRWVKRKLAHLSPALVSFIYRLYYCFNKRYKRIS